MASTPDRTVNTLVSVLSALVLVYGLLVAAMYLFQPKLIYFPSNRLDTSPTDAGLAFEDVHIHTQDGVTLHGWFVPAAGSQLTLLFLHGNGGNISHRLDSLVIFNQLGLNSFIFDYRGYGRSTGSPSEPGTYTDALAAWEYLTTERGVAPEHIIVFGRSLGGAVAIWLVANRVARALIVESCFTSIPDLAAHHYPLFPVRWLSWFSYDSLKRIGGITIPVLFVHSRNDQIVPYHHGRQLFAAAPQPKRFVEIHGDHNGGFLQSIDVYVASIQSFLRSLPGA